MTPHPLGLIPSSRRLGVANLSAPYLLAQNSARWGNASWAQAILGLPDQVPVYQGALTRSNGFGNLRADWGVCNGGSDDGATSAPYSNSIIREVLSNDSNYSWQNLTYRSVNTEAPKAWLFDDNGSSGSHSATQFNQLYYFGNEQDQSTPYCSPGNQPVNQACACSGLIRTFTDINNKTTANYDAWLLSVPYFGTQHNPYW